MYIVGSLLKWKSRSVSIHTRRHKARTLTGIDFSVIFPYLARSSFRVSSPLGLIGRTRVRRTGIDTDSSHSLHSLLGLTHNHVSFLCPWFGPERVTRFLFLLWKAPTCTHTRTHTPPQLSTEKVTHTPLAALNPTLARALLSARSTGGEQRNECCSALPTAPHHYLHMHGYGSQSPAHCFIQSQAHELLFFSGSLS